MSKHHQVIEGKHFKVSQSSATFFKSEGSVTFDGMWARNDEELFGIFVDTDPRLMKSKVEELIRHNELLEGKEIAQLQVRPSVALSLYLEGVLKMEFFKHADEHGHQHGHKHAHDHTRYIDVPGVQICGRTLTVRILERTDRELQVADAHGNPI